MSDFHRHFPTKVSKQMVDYARDVVFLHSRYMFIRKDQGLQFGVCTHCQKQSLIGPKSYLKHNDDYQCRKCKSLVKVKSAGRGRKNLFTDAYFVWYDKSKINKKGIVARGIYAFRDYTKDYRNTQTMFQTVAMYLFEPGNSEMLVRDHWNQTWHEPKKIRSEMNISMQHKTSHVARESIYKAVKGTPFQYSTWERYSDDDRVKFFDLASKYPCIEYLSKMGLQKIVEAKLYGLKTYSAINWRGKTMEKVLRLPKHEIKTMQSAHVILDPVTLHTYQYYKKIGFPVTFQQAGVLSDLMEGQPAEILHDLRSQASRIELSKYILKQTDKDPVSGYQSAHSAIIAIRDYWAECEELGMDLQLEHVKYPNDLYAAHQKTMKKMKMKKDKELDAQIAKRVQELSSYFFEHKGLFIRPVRSNAELFNEGKTLSHCVGMYAKRYAEGETNLFVIRKTTSPSTPFYTLEIVNGQVIQAYGLKNKLPTQQVQQFIDQFKSVRLTKTKSKIAQPA